MVIKYPEDNKYKVTSMPPTTTTAAPVEAPSAAPKGSIFTDNSSAASSSHETSSGVDVPQSTSPDHAQGPDAAKAEPKNPPKIAKNMTLADRYLAKYPNNSKDEVIEVLQRKLDINNITDEEKIVLDELLHTNSEDASGASPQPTLYDSKKAEYEEIYSKTGTEYEKTSRVIDKYLFENNSEYANITNERQKRAYRDSMIASMREKLGYSSNITQAQRNIMQKEIAKLFIDAASSGVPLTKDTPSSEVKIRLSAIDNNSASSSSTSSIKDFKIDETKSTHEQLHDIVDYVLTQTDPNYRKLTDSKQKLAYIDAAKGKLSEQLFKIDINSKNLKPEEKDAIEKLAIAAFKTLQQSNGDESFDQAIKKLISDTTMQNEFICKVLTENNDLINKIQDPKVKLTFETALVKTNLYNEIKSNNPDKVVTERDILQKLKELQKNGKLDSEALKELYNVYTNLDKLDAELKAKNPHAQSLLSEESNLTSLASMSALAGMTPERFIEVALQDTSGKWPSSDVLKEKLSGLKKIVGEGTDAPGVMMVRDLLLKHHSVEEVGQMLRDAGMYSERAVKFFIAHGQHQLAADATNTIARVGTEQEKTAYSEILSVTASVLNSDGMKGLQTSLSTQAFSLFGDNLNQGVHQYYSQADQDAFRNSMVTDPNVSSDLKSLFTKSYIITGTSEQQLHDAQYFSTVNDSAVTEGLAASVNHISDHNVRNAVSSYVDNAIANNGYSSSEISAINNARATGQTSYSSSTSSASSSNSYTSSASNNTTQTTTYSNTAASGNSQQTVNISATNKNTVNELRAQLAQINYEHSLALRNKAISDLEHIIDKIQNDQEVRAQKQSELSAKEIKTEEEVAQIVKEAEIKSSQEQEKAQKDIANEFVEELEQDKKLEKKYNISIDTINELRNAQRQGDLSKIYSKLGSISADAQKHFIQYLSRKDTATIIGFIRNRSTDKSLIRELCKLNPSLIKVLDPNMLLDCGIAKADIIKYADPHQLSAFFYELAKVGNTDALNQFYEVLGNNSGDIAGISKPVPGDDRYFEMLKNNMSIASSKVPMRQDINKKVPRHLWG